MRKILVTLLSTVAMMGIASLAFAADGAPVKLDSASLGLAIFGCAIGMAVAAAGCGIGGPRSEERLRRHRPQP